MFGERLAGIDDHNAHLRALDRAMGTQARVVLVPGSFLDPAADPSGIDEPIDVAADLNELIDGVHGGPGDLIDDHPLLSRDLVEQA